ncbi:MAG: hypothetical protein N2D54_00250, partial [Chloroflexota bacterium]
MSKHLLNSTRIFLFFIAVEAALATYSLFLIPTDPKNAWLFGYSMGRWGLATFGIIVMALSSNFLLASFPVSSQFRNFLKILYEFISTPLRWSIITMISLGGFSTSLTILISTLTYEFNTSYIRTAPILALVSLLFLQFGILITYLYVKNGWHASINQAEITTSRKLLAGLFLTSFII